VSPSPNNIDDSRLLPVDEESHLADLARDRAEPPRQDPGPHRAANMAHANEDILQAAEGRRSARRDGSGALDYPASAGVNPAESIGSTKEQSVHKLRMQNDHLKKELKNLSSKLEEYVLTSR